MTKPILIRTGGLTNLIYAIRRYREQPAGHIVSSAKDDVTTEAINAVIDHARRCISDTCSCDGLRSAAKENYHVVQRA